MFFEGTEKKVEIIVSDRSGSLKDKSHTFWKELVAKSDALILSNISNKYCTAFLLSESSLFIFADRFIMITCGQTKLIRSIEYFIDYISPKNIKSIIYERKNELFPGKQDTTFLEDIGYLNKRISGKSYIFGKEYGHYLLLYNSEQEYKSDSDDCTLEFMMYGIDNRILELFKFENRKDKNTKDFIDMLHGILPKFKIDDYYFEPLGFSLNAIKENSYFTFHITAEDLGSYVSFETNYRFKNNELPEIIHKITGLFKPDTFDVICFNLYLEPEKIDIKFAVKTNVFQKLSNDYNVQYITFVKLSEKQEPARELISL